MKNNKNPEGSAAVNFLGRWGEWASVHWKKTLLIALAITIIMGIGFSSLKLELTYYSMMPKASRQVRDLKKIIKEFPAASSIVVVLQAEDRHNREDAEKAVKAAVDNLTKMLSGPGYSDYVSQVDGKIDPAFFKEHGLMLLKAKDIKRYRKIFSDPGLVPFLAGLNNDFEKEYSGNEEKLSEDKQQITSQFKGLKEILEEMKRYTEKPEAERLTDAKLSSSIDRFLFGSPYFLNRDGTMALLFIRPTFTINDMDIFVKAIPLLDRAIKKQASSLHVKAGLTGLIVVGKDEMVTSEKGLAVSTTIALILILIIMILSFKMYSAPLISGIPLVIGLIWTMGLTGFVIKRLNILTAMYMIALIGLGIDYAIHLLTTYVQERDDGNSFTESVKLSLHKSGAGIVMGALTTAVAFFALTVAKSAIVKELGIVAGFGIICELLAMLILIPAILGYRNHRLLKRGKTESSFLNRNKLQYRVVSGLGTGIKAKPLLFMLLTLAAGAVLATQANRVSVEGNMMKMEAKGLESIELQDTMVREFGFAPDTLSVITGNIESARKITAKIKKLGSVKEVESIIPFYPSQKEQTRRIKEIKAFKKNLVLQAGLPGSGNTGGKASGNTHRKAGNNASGNADEHISRERLINELNRLKDNLLEMSDLAYSAGMDKILYALNNITGLNMEGKQTGEPVIDKLIKSINDTPDAMRKIDAFQKYFSGLMRQKLLKMADTKRIDISMIPDKIRSAYISKDKKSYLINIVPAQNPWITKNRRILLKQLSTVTDRATGMVLAADQMTQIAEHDGIKAAITAIIVIFFLLLLDFRNLKLSVVTLSPLVLSFASLFGIMAIAGIKFDFINIISVPLLIGIGIDDAVHINHRYLLEGKGHIDTVIEKTGKAVFLTSLTTVIGFASFIPSIMRAMRSTGIVLSMAMVLAFVFSILFYPSVLMLMREKLNMNILPWGYKNNGTNNNGKNHYRGKSNSDNPRRQK